MAALDNYITFVIIPQKTSRVVRLRISRFVLRFLFLIGIIFSIATIGILFDYFGNKKSLSDYKEVEKSIIIQNINLKSIENQLTGISKQLSIYDIFDRKLRIISGLLDAPQRIRFAIGGGENENTVSNTVKGDQKTVSMKIASYLKDLDRYIKLREISFFQVETFILDRKDRLDRTPSIAPTTGYITSAFGTRMDPFTGQPKMHEGLDWGNRPFTPIYAPADGEVTGAFDNGNFGKFLVINHGYKIVTRYAHLAKYEVVPGQKVKRGDLIARMGNSGRSTGTHLHYEVRVDDVPTDPEKYILNMH